MPDPTEAPDPDHPAAAGPSARERFAEWALRGPLAAGLGALAVVQIATWVPHYLTWPLWTDHDVFATAAREWSLGTPPYRSSFGNNFPGTIYIFWGLGKLCGWGKTWPIYALDSGIVVGFGALMLAWSRRRLGGFLPGLCGLMGLLSYLMNLDYSLAAQRDWHAPALGVGAILLLETGPGRWRLALSALMAGAALSIRPQVVLLVPALVASAGRWRRSVPWLAIFGVATAAAFAPLAVSGVLGDFRRSLQVVAVGSDYQLAGGSNFVRELAQNVFSARLIGLAAAAWLLSGSADGPPRHALKVWSIALAGLLLYKAISPQPHAYLDHPMAVGLAVLASLVAALLLSCPGLRASVRLAAIGLMLTSGMNVRPRFCNVAFAVDAVRILRSGIEPVKPPMGYARNAAVKEAAIYYWEDYRNMLVYLREHVDEDIAVANCLKSVPAITGAVDRRSALPAESIAWLRFVRASNEEAFATRLEQTPRSVAVWSPAEYGDASRFRIDALSPVIRREYQPEARFGTIEVWRRKKPR